MPASEAETDMLLDAIAILKLEAADRSKAELEKIENRKSRLLALFDDIPAPKKERKTSGSPMYRNPNDPEKTWTGCGKAPMWFKVCVANGTPAEDMKIPV